MDIQIKSLRAINCGPLRDVVLDFTGPDGKPRPTTLVAGPNGSGKTTVLELIATLFEMLSFHYGEDVGFDHFDFLHDDAQYAQLDVTLLGSATSLFLGTPPPDAQMMPQVVGWSSLADFRKYSINGDESMTLRRALLAQNGKSTHDLKQRKRDSTVLPTVIYMSHVRKLSESASRSIERAYPLYKLVYRYSPDSDKSYLSPYLIWLDYSAPRDLEELRLLISDVLGGKKIYIDRTNLEIFIRLQNGQNHRLNDLSSGEQNLLVIIIELHRRLLTGSVVLIDEVENSLHPGFQYLICDALKALQKRIPFQLILTSHSKTFLEIVEPRNTLILPSANEVPDAGRHKAAV